MSNYTDDTQDTLVISDSTQSEFSQLFTDVLKASEALLFGLAVSISSSAVIADEVTGSASTITSETLMISDTLSDRIHATNYSADWIVVTDKTTNKITTIFSDSATAQDSLDQSIVTLTTDTLAISDTLSTQRTSQNLTEDTLHAVDVPLSGFSDSHTDTIQAHDSVSDAIHVEQLLSDVVTISDTLTGFLVAGNNAVDVAVLSDETADHLTASNLFTETAVIFDEIFYEPLGVAWTANTKTWAASQYAQYAFSQVAVINNVAYGIKDDGVYALSGGSGVVSGFIQTGKMDLGIENGLVHPIHAYLEYEKTNGTAQMDVTTTQSGTPETYTYTLVNETADELTNGRFIFGRGLRGRHFQFALRFNAEKAYVNNLLVDITPTRRRT